MPRPPIERAVTAVPPVTLFKPAGVPARDLEHLQVAVDELEAMRLVDLEGLSHEQAAEVMGVSRQTVGRVLERGRAKVAEAIVAGKAIVIGGGQYRVEPRRLLCRVCGERWVGDAGHGPAATCPACGSSDVALCWGPGGRCGRRRGRGDGTERCPRGSGRGAGGGRRGAGRGAG